ncbi:ADP-ribosylarginine hydrolase Tri1 [Pantoea agglomerans]|uniref:ADP-ribosylarginine hydrolase Tri1 n=1 Tax=Enterobacter agglomerans TaxID=549 RepID=UPI0017837524|nr:ADP-ribosylarginine hydrolase Tri1 [Pantoea agglomerans]WVJ45017.1 ADP-ribosylarginine hydrolase Tri1 [Pantoea agglomerans]
MMDLRAGEDEIFHYAQRYAHLIPPVSRQLMNRMSYNPIPMPETAEDKQKPKWMYSQPQKITDVQALDKAQGALMGLAAGDAIGTTLAFVPRDKAYVDDMVGMGPFNLKPGEWTDDTSMALCLAETYIESHKCDTTLFRQKLLSWYRNGTNSSNGVCFDIGNTTRVALEQFERQGPTWMGNSSPDTAGNAALVRLAPTAIFRRKSFVDALRDAKQQSNATHRAAESVSCCRFLILIFHYLLNGYSKSESLAPHLMGSSLRVLLINAGEYKEKYRDQIRSSAYVIDTLEAALWAVWHTDNFKDAVLLAANLGNDADSIAAAAGQLAGALYGLSGIPEGWVEKIAHKERILSLAKQLFEMAPDEKD